MDARVRAGFSAAAGRIAALGLLVIAAGGCGRERDGSGGAALRGNGVNILLITVDTLRPDHLGMYGYGRPTSPNIDRWFGDQIVFERAYTTEASTSPAVMSLLTGLLPQNHHVRMFFQLAPDHVQTLADPLRRAGYQTAGVVSNLVLTNEAIGLGDRFDDYDDYVDERELIRSVWERNARRTTDAALAWLLGKRDEDRPHFLWVHYVDPHGPYEPPPDRPVDFTHARSQPVDESRILPFQRIEGETDVEEYVDRYDEEIAYCDREVGRLLDAYREMGLADGAVIVFTSDHGETMAEHEWWFTHTYHVYESIARIPLAIRAPGRAGGRVSRLVSLVDVAPTLLELAGLKGVGRFDGQSLFANGVERTVFMGGTGFGGKLQRRAMVRGNDKWLVQIERGTGRLVSRWRYDLSTDPSESRGRSWFAEDEKGAAPLLALIATDPDPGGLPKKYAAGRQIDAPKVAPGVSDKVRERLRTLGYVR